MKRLIFFPLLFIIVLFSKGQSLEVKVDYDYFLFGTLDDYMGREKHKGTVDQVEVYSKNNKSFAFFLESIFQNKYPDLKLTTDEKSGQLKLHSKSLAQKMNDFYFFEPSSRGAYSGEADFQSLNLDSIMKTDDWKTKYFDKIYIGHIKSDVFKSDSERQSFITGAYLRFGGKNDSIYFISIPNSISKVKVVTEQLNELKCTNVNYIIKKDYIPCGHTVYFTPTDELKKYFKAFDYKQ